MTQKIDVTQFAHPSVREVDVATPNTPKISEVEAPPAELHVVVPKRGGDPSGGVPNDVAHPPAEIPAFDLQSIIDHVHTGEPENAARESETEEDSTSSPLSLRETFLGSPDAEAVVTPGSTSLEEDVRASLKDLLAEARSRKGEAPASAAQEVSTANQIDELLANPQVAAYLDEHGNDPKAMMRFVLGMSESIVSQQTSKLREQFEADRAAAENAKQEAQEARTRLQTASSGFMAAVAKNPENPVLKSLQQDLAENKRDVRNSVLLQWVAKNPGVLQSPKFFEYSLMEMISTISQTNAQGSDEVPGNSAQQNLAPEQGQTPKVAVSSSAIPRSGSTPRIPASAQSTQRVPQAAINLATSIVGARESESELRNLFRL